MKLKNFIFVLLILSSIICSGAPENGDREELEILLGKTSTINGVIEIKENGFLGAGCDGFVYEGTIIKDQKFKGNTVAVKFVYETDRKKCEKELKMYCYLKAYRNDDAEKYGIPILYYYSRWENYVLMAMTMFEKDLSNVNSFNDLDVLILLRDFVFQTKYIHSCGVRHDDIKPKNIMIRKNRYFLIDFGGSSKMEEYNHICSLKYGSKRSHDEQRRYAIDDYESFLYTISEVTNRMWFSLFDDKEEKKNALDTENVLQNIIKAFADEVFPSNGELKEFPNYDKLEEMISKEITKLDSQKYSLIGMCTKFVMRRKIKNIREPSKITKFDYPSPPAGLLEA